jgi:hypothetical protein
VLRDVSGKGEGKARGEVMVSRRATTLEARLTEWGKEYGGGKYETYVGLGNSPLASLMKWHGRPPTGLGFVSENSAADEVQSAIDALAEQPRGWLSAQVIRCEYLTPGQPVESKLRRLRAVGENVSRVRYYEHLRLARVHVAAWLRIPFDEDSPRPGVVSVQNLG